MHRHDERAEFFLVKILELVNQQRDGNLSLLGGFRHRDKQIGQVTFQIAAVRRAFFRVNVQANLHVAQRHFDAVHETLEHGQSAFSLVTRARHAIQLKEQLAQRRHKQGRQRFVLMGFHHHRAIAGLESEPVNFIEQHRLADTAQPGEQNTFLGSPCLNATKEDARLFEDSRTTNQLGRGRTCAGGERIFDGVHTMLGDFYLFITMSSHFPLETTINC